MTSALTLQPRGRAGRPVAALIVDPARGSLIKEERKTVVWRQALPDGTPAVLKLYRHRNPSWLERRGWYTGRAAREFKALCHLEDHRVAGSRPLFWATGETAATGRFELLATREVADGVDLRTWLTGTGKDAGVDWKPLFALAATLHRTGLQHGALLARNVLLAGHDFYLIDLPRCQFFARSIEGTGPGWFDIKVLVQSLAPLLPGDTLAAGLTGYPRLPGPALDLVRSLRRKPMSNRRLNTLHAVYTVQAGWSLFFTKPAVSP